MIEKPIFVSRNGTECPIRLGVNVNAFDDSSKLGMKVQWEGVVCVKWSNKKSNIEFKFSNETAQISAYPTPNMEKMVVVKLGEKFGTSNNSIILNDKGDIIFTPELPKRISKEEWLPKGDLYCFMQSGWCDYADYIFFYLSIDNTDWVETRYFNYKEMKWDEERYETWRL